MAKVKCAICREELDSSKAYYCPRHELWVDFQHAEKGGPLEGRIVKCPIDKQRIGTY